MRRNILAGISAALAALMFTSPATAQSPSGSPADVAALELKSQEALEAEKWVSFYSTNMKLHQLLPYEPKYLVNVVKACGMLDRKSTAYHYMLQIQQQGVTYDFNADDETLKIRNTEAYQHINNMLIDAAKPSGEGTTAFTLQGSGQDYRALAWDPSREAFLAGTVEEGVLLTVTESGEAEVLLKANEENGLWSITGLAVDVKNNRLWVASSATPHFKGFSAADKNRSALFEFDLNSIELLGRYNVPVDGLDHELGTVAITEEGHVYVIDRATPIIYAKLPGSDRLEAVFASPGTRALDSITVTPDNSRVFVSDAVKGVLVIDPVARQARMLTGPETMNLGGIESISYRDRQLYVVQGRFTPPRIVRLELDSSGAGATSVSPMAIALDPFDQPGVGTIRGDNLYYLANAGAGDESGATVMSTPLAAGAEATPPRVIDNSKAITPQEKQE
ncbi:MAG: hypothetical protein HKO99_14350 [Xanthomonadales bacterium]|nr:hypothetical protein [Gammaproteobacteria bacterium]NNK52772.1 hypothetical protein [Xanthomonadales bacterium]